MEQLNYSKHSRQSKQSRYSKQAIKIEDNVVSLGSEMIEALEEEKHMISGASSI